MGVSAVLKVSAVACLATVALAACGDAAGVHESVGTSTADLGTTSGCDYSFARPTPASLASMGYKFVCRYLSGDPSGGKDITASEQADLEAGGIDIVLNWETTGTDASNGYNAGVSDATAAKAEAESVNQPPNRPIYFSIDFDAQSGDAAAINEYFKGVASVIGVSRTGVYGGYYIVNELFNAGLVTWGWQTYAWSNGAWDSRAQLRQVQNGVDNGQLDADTGMVVDFGQYGPGSPVAADGGVAGYYAATYVSQSWPLASSTWSLTACQTVASSITLKNTGTLPWDSNTRLGTTQPRDRKSDFADSTWLSVNRAAAVTGTVPPGGTFEFKFDFHAPPTAGTYTEYFGLVQDGVAWFSDNGQGGPPDNDIEANITVTGTGNCAIDPGVPDGAAGGGNDAGSKHADSGVGSSPGDDAGATATSDSGVGEEPDAGSGGGADAGSNSDAATGSGGGCSVTATPLSPRTGAWVLVAGALVVALRRRKRPASC